MRYKGFRVEFSNDKDLILKETRGVGFEEIIVAIEAKAILSDLEHRNQKYAHQRILVVKVAEYAYVVPYVVDLKRNVIFLKTAYPSRFWTAKYLKGGK